MNLNISIFRCYVMVFLIPLTFHKLVFAVNWNPLPDTGQTHCYDISGNTISCPAFGQPLSGQDAQYVGGIKPYRTETIGNDTIVIDDNTNLIWQQRTADVNGDGVIGDNSSYPTGDLVTWQDAKSYCDVISYAGVQDWRLPSVRELESIIDYGHRSPAINPVFECQISKSYWTSTASANGGPTNVWNVRFLSGKAGTVYNMNTGFVRCVRGGS